ncbi:MAG TPA: SRPBCC family protein [Thermoanaerobaculaceae bacterium]|nr:SRPBCC family protein [Thermoanaerobaculaceae bacterium]HPS76716.1 SRPBCC family protein [Thermoanaerobaculaceae bacterium]
MRIFKLDSTMWLPRDRVEVFAFFADARNLETLTPPWLGFQILTPMPLDLRAGARIDYRLRVRGVPLRWQSEIAAWEPPTRFVDEQRHGPYRLWVHEHTFVERDGGTEVRDHVTYAVPGGWLVERLLVGPDLRRIFAFRRATLARLFGLAPMV